MEIATLIITTIRTINPHKGSGMVDTITVSRSKSAKLIIKESASLLTINSLEK